MTRAVKALIPFVFRTLGLHRIEAACLTGNDASRKLLMRSGFSQEGLARRYLLINGEWADHLLFALLKEEAQLG
jgi:ribosomal-protein-alanine N-acetyltransferase